MRVVILRSNPVLPDPRVEKEANELLKNGYEVQILAWNRNGGKGLKERGHIKVQCGSISTTWLNIKANYGNGLKTLLPIIFFQVLLSYWLIKNRNKYDCIHACDFDTGLTGLVCSKILKKKIVYDIFDYYIDSFNVPRLLKSLVEFLDLKVINHSNAVIITNESRRVQIKKSRPKYLEVIHNSPEKIKMNSTLGSNEKLKVVYVGILSENRLLKEVVELISESEACELHIAGFGQLETMIYNYSTTYKNIEYYGRIKYNDTLKLETECDVLFATYNPLIENHRYSSPNKLYEAMMLGKPIIVCKGTGIDEIVEKLELGLVIDYNRISFKNALAELTREKETWKNKESEIQRIYDTYYSWELMSQRLIKLYHFVSN
ncbi:glycosyltransferase family 4 protein [Cohnella sp. GCM10020058]|uniref:glycosyltransferase family 4 protein n=1 Tax=Cohnella sp. GCM10020058 TaxID=3317330 RepID=UPI003626ED0F